MRSRGTGGGIFPSSYRKPKLWRIFTPIEQNFGDVVHFVAVVTPVSLTLHRTSSSTVCVATPPGLPTPVSENLLDILQRQIC